MLEDDEFGELVKEEMHDFRNQVQDIQVFSIPLCVYLYFSWQNMRLHSELNLLPIVRITASCVGFSHDNPFHRISQKVHIHLMDQFAKTLLN